MQRNQAFADHYKEGAAPRHPTMREQEAVRDASWPLFLNYPMFFVKVSDVMAQVPRKPHLRDLKIHVSYHEAIMDEEHATNPRAKTLVSKWRSDPGMEGKWTCPGKKIFQNGVLLSQAGITTTPMEYYIPRPAVSTGRKAAAEAMLQQFLQQHEQQQAPKPSEQGRGETMDVDKIVIVSSDPAEPSRVAPSMAPAGAQLARRPLPATAPFAFTAQTPTNGNGNNSPSNKSDTMNGHFAGDFAGYSMHGATGSRPNSSSGPNGGTPGSDPSHPAHPSLPTFRDLTQSPEMGKLNGDKGLERK